MANIDQEVIFESWLFKYQGGEGRHSLRLSSGWKRRYIILLRDGAQTRLLYYDKKPKTLQDDPKGRVLLDTWYTIHKRSQYRGKDHVCEVYTGTSRILTLATDDEKIFHLLTFFLQTQVKLREQLEAECFVVRPDGSDDQMKIGARGSMCLLHVSKGGLSVALQLSRSMLIQWPLNCIKFYDSTVRGQFTIETGSNAPNRTGKFVFNTRHEENIRIYDLLDKHVMELSGLKQIAMTRNSTQEAAAEKLMAEQYGALQNVIIMRSDQNFIPHLKKVSRGIYDQLSEHLGVTSTSRLDVRQPDLESLEDGPPMMRFAPKRSASQQGGARPKLPSEDITFMSLGRQPKSRIKHAPPEGATAAAVSQKPSTKHPNQIEPQDSAQYLPMDSPTKNKSVQGAPQQYNNQKLYRAEGVSQEIVRGGKERPPGPDSEYLRMSGEPSPGMDNKTFSMKEEEKDTAKSNQNPYFVQKGSTYYLDQDTGGSTRAVVGPAVYQDMTGSPPKRNVSAPVFNGDESVRPKMQPNVNEFAYSFRSLLRQQSRSCEDVSMSEYSKVSENVKPRSPTVYENSTVEDTHTYDSARESMLYSYANPPDLQTEIPSPTRIRFKNDVYTKPFPKELRKSLSLSDLLDEANPSHNPRPVIAKKPSLDGSNNNVGDLRSKNRPPNFDFSKLPTEQSTSSPATTSTSTTTTPTTSTSTTSDETYKHIGNSKFWSTHGTPTSSDSPSQSTQSPTTIKGIAVTGQTRVFSRKKVSSPEKQAGVSTTPETPGSAVHSILREELSSMRGRRLPSLPPGVNPKNLQAATPPVGVVASHV